MMDSMVKQAASIIELMLAIGFLVNVQLLICTNGNTLPINNNKKLIDSNEQIIDGLTQTIRNSNLTNNTFNQSNEQIPFHINKIENGNSNNNNNSSSNDDAQNPFQSSISCGHLEFYVQLTFTKPFRGLVYAYKMYQHSPLHSARYDYYYPIEILDSCTIRGNGASIVYLELSFLSECVEKLPPLDDELLKQYAQMQPSLDTNNDRRDTNFDPAIQNELIDSTNQSINQFPQTNIHTFNLDGFNFRRALNDNKNTNQINQLNISKDTTYQLSLYIQNDPKIEQKFDSKVVVQCSPHVTKNIILEQNSMNEFYRKLDRPRFPMAKAHNKLPPSANGQRSQIIPNSTLTFHLNDNNNNNDEQSGNNQMDLFNLIESRIDILRGRIPFLKLIDHHVELGDDVTLIIRTKELDGFDTKISNCYAHNEQNTMRYQLINENGCPIDRSLMAPFKIMHNTAFESKVYYSTFSIFKFPGSQHLNLQCTLTLCKQFCPKPNCDQMTQH